MIVEKLDFDNLEGKTNKFKTRQTFKILFKPELLDTLYNKNNWENSEDFFNPEKELICRHCNTEIENKRYFHYFTLRTPKNDFFINLHSKCAFSENVHKEYDLVCCFGYTFDIIGGFD